MQVRDLADASVGRPVQPTPLGGDPSAPDAGLPAPIQVAHPAARTRPLNVLFVTDHLGYGRGVIHGASRYYLGVLPRFDPARVHPSLCILGEPHPFASELEAAGISPIFLNRGKWDLRAVRDLVVLIRRKRIDLLHCLCMKSCLVGRILGRFMGVPALIHLHDTNDPGRVIVALERCVAPWTAAALAVSDRVAQYASERLAVAPDRVRVLHNGLDIDQFAGAPRGSRERIRRELDIPAEAVVMLLAGRITAGKGQREVIDAIPPLLRRHPGAVLLLAGDGADAPACREAAARHGIAGQVRFAGQRRDMPEVLAASDIGLMPSVAPEGFGYVALEAAAAGLPVVASDTGGVRAIIEEGVTGLITPAGDMGALVGALEGLISDSERRREMGRRGAARAHDFGIDSHVSRLEDVYASLVRGATEKVTGP